MDTIATKLRDMEAEFLDVACPFTCSSTLQLLHPRFEFVLVDQRGGILVRSPRSYHEGAGETIVSRVHAGWMDYVKGLGHIYLAQARRSVFTQTHGKTRKKSIPLERRTKMVYVLERPGLHTPLGHRLPFSQIYCLCREASGLRKQSSSEVSAPLHGGAFLRLS